MRTRRPCPADRIVDVRTENPRGRHELIFDTFGTLAAETAFILVNDHDPKPLYYQLAAENLAMSPGITSTAAQGRIGKLATGG
ncbi:MAG: DUF2249 domain-containing protein [Jiangellaceae bacterium]